ncbi:hypothetical protein ABZ023_16680 [Streptomyces sp. NPDC006367]|uniref:hypothetical protein n=1 Tax=unclassified Streptomyces TaxID=2593676 RepID=UPI00339E7FE0
MPAPLCTRPHPTARDRAEARLPWWALALPVLAFVTLLLLILEPSEAHAAAGEPTLAHLLEWLRHVAVR